MIGSVQFAKPGEAVQRGIPSAQLDLQPGVSSRPSLDSVLGSARGQALLDSQVGLARQLVMQVLVHCLMAYMPCFRMHLHTDCLIHQVCCFVTV